VETAKNQSTPTFQANALRCATSTSETIFFREEQCPKNTPNHQETVGGKPQGHTTAMVEKPIKPSACTTRILKFFEFFRRNIKELFTEPDASFTFGVGKTLSASKLSNSERNDRHRHADEKFTFDNYGIFVHCGVHFCRFSFPIKDFVQIRGV
jgi:hypothetical protein